MTFSMKRIQAIFIKDYKDLQRNGYVLFTALLPLFFAFWLKGDGNPEASGLIFNLALVMSGCFVQAALIAEEKEKNTLRGLLLSPASTMDILIGKSALSFIITALVLIGCILITDFSIQNAWIFILVNVMALCIYIGAGTLIGLLSRTVMESSLIGMPAMFLFGMGSLIPIAFDNDIVLEVLAYLPNFNYMDIIIELTPGQSFSAFSEGLIILAVWFIVTILATLFVYRRRQFDK